MTVNATVPPGRDACTGRGYGGGHRRGSPGEALRRARTPARPEAADLERARPIIERSARTYPNLAYRGDKSLVFSHGGNAMLMYGRMGRSWIAMGDPVGPEDEARELARRFSEECGRLRRWCVFFEVSPEHLDWYLDLGLSITKLGEEARVRLAHFDLERPELARVRQARAKLDRMGCRFELVTREAVGAMLPELLEVSDAWLARKATREKGFSNATFDAAYLTHFPAAVVRRGGRIIAFANLWRGAGREELSVDLMRHRPDAPNGTMDLLFSELMRRGRDEGYAWFNLGMAPLSGLAAHADAPLWDRVGTFLYRHGEHFYNFRGVRAYKEKFDPAWTPLYLASPGGAVLPAILLDATALIAGGYAGIFTRRSAARRKVLEGMLELEQASWARPEEARLTARAAQGATLVRK
jgi:phosphatidylglycerol lysyltransferase